VRIWKAKKETGYIGAGTVICYNDWMIGEFHEVATLYGHAARVWDVVSLNDGSVVSIGEVS